MHEPANCPHCGDSFEPRKNQVGGLVNCPRCGRVVQVPGLRDPLWLLLRVGVVAAAVAVGWFVGKDQPPLGIAAGAAVLGGAWLLSRAF